MNEIIISEARLLDYKMANGIDGIRKSLPCAMVLRLMDTEEFSCNYCGALNLVAKIFPKINVQELERELDRFI